MIEPGVLDGLAATPPGPALAAALGGLDLGRVPGDRVIEVLREQSRQSAHQQARLWATLLQVGLAVPDEPGAGRAVKVAEWAPGEIAAALTWTHRTAERELGLAEVVVGALPQVFAALEGGRIDRGKAVVFAEFLDPAHGVTAEQAAAILARLLPVAPGLTTGQLRARLWRALLAIDPGWARRRYVKAVRGRTVTAVLADDGTVTICGSGLPADEAAVACARVDRLAEAAKRAGHRGRLGQIAADVYLGLLDGRFHDLSEEQIISVLLRVPRSQDLHSDDARADDARANDAPAGGAATEQAAEDTGRGSAPADTTRPGAGDTASRPPADPAGADSDVAGPPTADGRSKGAGAQPAAGVPETVAKVRVGIEIRVGLGTLLGLDERPGEIPGLGPVLPGVARTVVARQRRGAEWRFAVTDRDGYLLLAGVTRRRPHANGQRGASAGASRGGIVELQVPATQLDQLAADAAAGRLAPGWAGVVADIARQFTGRHTLLAALDDRPTGRFPGAALARHVQVRDRTCSHPGCQRPARRSDLDHTRDHARGGATVRANVGPGCGRHHLFKHELGWTVAQPEPGIFVWTSPLGQRYRTRGEPITPPLPGPRPCPVDPDDSGRIWIEGPILNPPDPPPSAARPPPAPADPDEPPPF